MPPKKPPPCGTQHLSPHLWDTPGCPLSPQSPMEGATCSKVRDFGQWKGWEKPWRERVINVGIPRTASDWKLWFFLMLFGAGNQQGKGISVLITTGNNKSF